MRAQFDREEKRVIVHEGKFLRMLKIGQWEYIERNNCTAIVIILAMTEDQKVIFVEQYRPPVGKRVIEFPAGLVNDRGLKEQESIASAAKRELLEETGYRAGKIQKILDGPVSGGSSADMVTMFQALEVEKVSDGGGDEFESIVVHEVPLESSDQWLDEMNSNGFLIEPKIYTGLYFLKSYNNFSARR